MDKFFRFSLLLLAVIVISLLSIPFDTQAQVTTARLVTVLEEDGRTEDTNSLDIVNAGENLNVRGAYITLDVTDLDDTPTITLTVQAKDAVSGKYENILIGAGIAATGTHTYLIYPGAGTAAENVVETLSYPLPPQWRVNVTHLNTNTITYTVGALLVN